MRRRRSSRPSGASATISVFVPPKSMPNRTGGCTRLPFGQARRAPSTPLHGIIEYYSVAHSPQPRRRHVLSTRYLVILAVAAGLGGLPAVAHGQLNLLCPASVTDWCKLLADEFGKETGVKVTLVVPSGGRGALATLA